MEKIKVRLSGATFDILGKIGDEEKISERDVAVKAMQVVGIVHAYNQEGKVFVALDGNTGIRSTIEIPRSPDEGEREFFLHVSGEIHLGLTRIAEEMMDDLSAEDVFCIGVLLYEKIREQRSRGMRFGVTNKFHPDPFHTELFIPGITVL